MSDKTDEHSLYLIVLNDRYLKVGHTNNFELRMKNFEDELNIFKIKKLFEKKCSAERAMKFESDFKDRYDGKLVDFKLFTDTSGDKQETWDLFYKGHFEFNLNTVYKTFSDDDIDLQDVYDVSGSLDSKIPYRLALARDSDSNIKTNKLEEVNNASPERIQEIINDTKLKEVPLSYFLHRAFNLDYMSLVGTSNDKFIIKFRNDAFHRFYEEIGSVTTYDEKMNFANSFNLYKEGFITDISPVILYKGQIIAGRHRVFGSLLKIIKELSITSTSNLLSPEYVFNKDDLVNILYYFDKETIVVKDIGDTYNIDESSLINYFIVKETNKKHNRYQEIEKAVRIYENIISRQKAGLTTSFKRLSIKDFVYGTLGKDQLKFFSRWKSLKQMVDDGVEDGINDIAAIYNNLLNGRKVIYKYYLKDAETNEVIVRTSKENKNLAEILKYLNSNIKYYSSKDDSIFSTNLVKYKIDTTYKDLNELESNGHLSVEDMEFISRIVNDHEYRKYLMKSKRDPADPYDFE